MMKNTIQIFVAGSKDLAEERSWVRNVASNLDANYSGKGKNIHFIVKDYLNFELTFDADGQQTNYNRYIAETADLAIFILDKNIGNITNQEFEVAYKAYSTGRRPKICILSKKHNQSNASIDNMRRRVTQLNQYYNEYETKEQFEKRVESLLRDCADPIIDKASSRKNNKIIFAIIAFALLVIASVLFYVTSKNQTTTQVQPQVVEITQESVAKDNSANNAEVVKAQPVKSEPVRKAETVTPTQQTTVAASGPVSTTSTKTSNTSTSEFYVTSKNQTTTQVQPQVVEITQESVAKDNSANNAEVVKAQPVKSEPVRKAETVTPTQQTTVAASGPVSTTSTKTSNTSTSEAVVAPQVGPSLKDMADQGDAASCYEYAQKLEIGDGVTQNVTQAFYYMKKAAEGGYAPAYRPLAEMYHKGQGVTKNRDIAAEWYQRAADNGDRKALQILNNM